MPERLILSLHRSLSAHHPRIPDARPDSFRAAVALVVRPSERDLELLLIKRAQAPNDPWSGHMAFPGGRRDPGEEDLETAIREVHEEVGVDLRAEGMLLGQLDAVQPRRGAPAVLVVPFVFSVPEGTGTRVNREVERTFWVPLSELRAPGAASEYLHALSGGARLRFPALVVQEQVVWGLTYGITMRFLEFARTVNEEESGCA